MTNSTTGFPPTLLVFADDWGRHASSCQHLVRQLLTRYEVLWVNTIMRPPSFDLKTLSRTKEKLGHWLGRSGTPADANSNPRVVNPRMWPWFGSAFSRRLNRSLLSWQLARVVKALPSPPIAITTLPIVADLMDALPVRHWVYYCVDDFGQWPGLNQGALRRMEEALVRRADILVTVSLMLQQKLARMGREARHLDHGVELDFWRGNGRTVPLPQLDGLERPLVVFWGVIDCRMDPRLVWRLAQDLQRGTIVLVGPETNPDPALLKIPRVVRLPPLPLERLPHLGREAAVLIMPYADLPVTRAIQPMKLKEYLATGKPTVVSDLPGNRGWRDCADLTDTPETFSRVVRLRLETGVPENQQKARARLAGESWAEKAKLFEHWALHGEGRIPTGDSKQTAQR